MLCSCDNVVYSFSQCKHRDTEWQPFPCVDPSFFCPVSTSEWRGQVSFLLANICSIKCLRKVTSMSQFDVIGDMDYSVYSFCSRRLWNITWVSQFRVISDANYSVCWFCTRCLWKITSVSQFHILGGINISHSVCGFSTKCLWKSLQWVQVQFCTSYKL